jgi:hypothetical protein
MPFGSEFTVLVKNLNSRRAKFTLHIDGTDVLDGTEIIVNANSEVELKRFIRNGNMTEGNAFKFIERTAAIENGPRGIKVDDGVVRVEYWFEQEKPIITTTVHRHEYWYDYPYRRTVWERPWGPPFGGATYTSYNSSASSDMVKSSISMGSSNINAAVQPNCIIRGAAANIASSAPVQAANAVSSVSADASISEVNEAGITVPGSKVEQSFHAVYGFNSEAKSEVIILRMAGVVGAIEVAAPVTVKTSKKCATCGKVNKATASFCSQCGTALTLL